MKQLMDQVAAKQTPIAPEADRGSSTFACSFATGYMLFCFALVSIVLVLVVRDGGRCIWQAC